MKKTTRRRLLVGAGALATASVGMVANQRIQHLLGQPETAAATFACPDYDQAVLVDTIHRGLAQFPQTLARARGGRVVLKPNIVEFHPDHPINTDARFLAAAVVAFRKHGAAEVLIAEGPGHHRDTELLLERTGLDVLMKDVGSRFVDLNLDRVADLRLVRNLTGMGRMKLAATAVNADLLVSCAKLKCHHWVGATLTMKNLFGVFPGSVYGWPKNPLHWAGLEQSILDIWDLLPGTFGLVDGVVGMEGDGPIMGTAKQVGAIVMGPQLPAVDATCARLMGFNAGQLGYLKAAARLGGTVDPSRIEDRGEQVAVSPFSVLPQFEYLLR